MHNILRGPIDAVFLVCNMEVLIDEFTLYQHKAMGNTLPINRVSPRTTINHITIIIIKCLLQKTPCGIRGLGCKSLRVLSPTTIPAALCGRASVCLCISVFMPVRVLVYVCLCVRARMQVCVCVCVCAYVHFFFLSGEILTIPGQGMPKSGVQGKRGQLLVKCEVEMPDKYVLAILPFMFAILQLRSLQCTSGPHLSFTKPTTIG